MAIIDILLQDRWRIWADYIFTWSGERKPGELRNPEGLKPEGITNNWGFTDPFWLYPEFFWHPGGSPEYSYPARSWEKEGGQSAESGLWSDKKLETRDIGPGLKEDMLKKDSNEGRGGIVKDGNDIAEASPVSPIFSFLLLLLKR